MAEVRMPAEWEPHRATWIAWPFLEADFPGKVLAVESCYCEIVRILSRSEIVEIVCATDVLEHRVRRLLADAQQDLSRVRFHQKLIDRTWLRDSAPTAVRNATGAVEWTAWKFNAWAKYENFENDRTLPEFIAKRSSLACRHAQRLDGKGGFVLEGGAIETDGAGTLVVTEECLLSRVQERNPGLDREAYEAHFRAYLGIKKTIWLGKGCLGDDTHGHIDDVARFVSPATVVVVQAEKGHPQYDTLRENRERLERETDAEGRQLRVITLPMPEDVFYQGEQLPASYANFYIANKHVLVPTFNDAADTKALEILRELFPQRSVIGIHARDLLVGQGTLHCLSQQEPLGQP